MHQRGTRKTHRVTEKLDTFVTWIVSDKLIVTNLRLLERRVSESLQPQMRVEFAKGGRRTGHHPFKRGWVAVAVKQALDDVSACGVIGNGTGNGILAILHNVAWFAHDAERSDAVCVILAARRSSEIASALFRSKSLAIRRTQMEEGDLNLFSSMVEFRKFIVDRNPCADAVVTLNRAGLGGVFRRLRATRVTFVDSTMRRA
ncbi:hypothetical protein GQ600_11448 [Phytophthora cactorum]|nr:hypothetical protein GQ600_11448 [Phytophthora cactorum]